MLNLKMKIRYVHIISLIWGSFWGAPQSCLLQPLHENQETDGRKRKKVKDLRQSNIAAYKKIKGQLPDSNFPIFAYLCTKH